MEARIALNRTCVSWASTSRRAPFFRWSSENFRRGCCSPSPDFEWNWGPCWPGP